MYGKRVHEAVCESGDLESGITIHLVNEHYDKGSIIAQFKVKLMPSDSAAEIEIKVRALEQEFYAPTVEGWMKKKITLQ